jgi:hypothetical protein
MVTCYLTHNVRILRSDVMPLHPLHWDEPYQKSSQFGNRGDNYVMALLYHCYVITVPYCHVIAMFLLCHYRAPMPVWHGGPDAITVTMTARY